jgi:hypothetical protein
MKFTLLFFSYSLFFSAQKPSKIDTNPAHKEQTDWENRKKQLEKSFKLWLQLKNDYQGNYAYTEKRSSSTGPSYTTTILISNNRVTERKFESMGTPHQDGRAMDKNRWTEKGEFIGSSSNKQAHPPVTLDQLYTEAKELLAKPIPPFHRGSLRLNEQGLLLSCYVQDIRIADDAPINGVNITSISIGSEKDPLLKTSPPTFEEWMANGKKLPEGMMFIGGSPWFNESKGQKRTAEEVYKMVFEKKEKAPTAKPTGSLFKPSEKKLFPGHWGDPPNRQTRDLRPLPGGYGRGSGTLAQWIQENLDRDKNKVSQSK